MILDYLSIFMGRGRSQSNRRNLILTDATDHVRHLLYETPWTDFTCIILILPSRYYS